MRQIKFNRRFALAPRHSPSPCIRIVFSMQRRFVQTRIKLFNLIFVFISDEYAEFVMVRTLPTEDSFLYFSRCPKEKNKLFEGRAAAALFSRVWVCDLFSWCSCGFFRIPRFSPFVRTKHGQRGFPLSLVYATSSLDYPASHPMVWLT